MGMCEVFAQRKCPTNTSKETANHNKYKIIVWWIAHTLVYTQQSYRRCFRMANTMTKSENIKVYNWRWLSNQPAFNTISQCLGVAMPIRWYMCVSVCCGWKWLNQLITEQKVSELLFTLVDYCVLKKISVNIWMVS